MSNHHKVETIEVCCPWVVIAWLIWPVRRVIQQHPGLSVADRHTHILALKEYGVPFFLVVALVQFGWYLYFLCLRERYLGVWCRLQARARNYEMNRWSGLPATGSSWWTW